jgi:hypothetical protein
LLQQADLLLGSVFTEFVGQGFLLDAHDLSESLDILAVVDLFVQSLKY